jgi:hypothetical protein
MTMAEIAHNPALLPVVVEPRQELREETPSPQERARTMILAREAWRRLTRHQTFQDWLQVGEALVVGRREVLALPEVRGPRGKKYSQAFSKWLDENNLRWMDEARTKEMDAKDRAALLKLMESQEKVMAWREGLSASNRLRLNHPRAVLQKWARTQVPQQMTQPRRQTVRAMVAELQEEVDSLKRAIHEEGSKILPSDEPSHVARVLCATLSSSKIKRLINELNKRIKEMGET